MLSSPENESARTGNPGARNGPVVNLAFQFSTILQSAHWTVFAAGATLGGIVFGIAAPDSNGTDALSLRGALQGAGFAFSTDPLPPWQATIGATRNAAFPTLMIGSRRPAVFP